MAKRIRLSRSLERSPRKTSRRMLQGGATSTACLFLLSIGVSPLYAQSTWSPEPFQSSQNIQSLNGGGRAIPSNSLRSSSAPAAAPNQTVVRWGSVGDTNRNPNASRTNAFRESSNNASAATVSARPISATIRSSQDIKQERSARTAVNASVHISDVNAKSGDHLRSVVWKNRSDNSTSVQAAQFEIPHAQESPAIPPTTPELGQPVAPSTEEGNRSLLAPEQQQPIPKSPFLNPTQEKAIEESPSDAPPVDQFENRLPQTQTPNRSRLEDCDSIRTELTNVNIHKVNLDVSPAFGVGPKSSDSPTKRRDSFAKDAPVRTWTDFRGKTITEGRLADLRYDAIEIEKSDGSREAVYLRDLSDADHVYVAEAWWLPVTCGISGDLPPVRNYVASTVTWRASGLCHKPLYYEDTQLERYGHEFGPVAQPLISSAHFFGNTFFLPYKVAINPLSECQYALGYYRPGNCAPWTVAPVPLSLKGAAAQGAAITGAAMVLP